jgi:hypothetical protein
VAEGAEFPVSDPATAEIDVITRKVTGLFAVTSELAEDSSREVAAEAGSRSPARDIAPAVGRCASRPPCVGSSSERDASVTRR